MWWKRRRPRCRWTPSRVTTRRRACSTPAASPKKPAKNRWPSKRRRNSNRRWACLVRRRSLFWGGLDLRHPCAAPHPASEWSASVRCACRGHVLYFTVVYGGIMFSGAVWFGCRLTCLLLVAHQSAICQGIITTIAGGGTGNGIAAQNLSISINGLATDSSGNTYVADDRSEEPRDGPPSGS